MEKSSSGVQDVLDTTKAGLSYRGVGRCISWYVGSSVSSDEGVSRGERMLREAVADVGSAEEA